MFVCLLIVQKYDRLNAQLKARHWIWVSSKSHETSLPRSRLDQEQNLMFACSPQWSWSGIKNVLQRNLQCIPFLFWKTWENCWDIEEIIWKLTNCQMTSWNTHSSYSKWTIWYSSTMATRPISICRLPIIERVARYDIWRGGSQNPA